MQWIRLAAAIIVFVTSCIGLGYLARSLVLRRKWPGWAGGLMSVAVALTWPAFVAGYTIYDARRCSAAHPHDDAPAMVVVSVITIGVPLLFLLSLPLAAVGSFLARRKAHQGALQ